MKVTKFQGMNSSQFTSKRLKNAFPPEKLEGEKFKSQALGKPY